jgi:hypothetical protein
MPLIICGDQTPAIDLVKRTSNVEFHREGEDDMCNFTLSGNTNSPPKEDCNNINEELRPYSKGPWNLKSQSTFMPTNNRLSATTSTNCKPVANAGPSQTVDSLAPVTLDGNESTGLQPLTYTWTPSSTEIHLVGANAQNPTFTAPLVHADTTYAITLVVTDSAGTQRLPASVNIKVVTPTVNIDLNHASTRPKTVAVPFRGIPAIYHLPNNMHTQPQVNGGDINVHVHLKGIHNPQTIPIRLSFDPRLDSKGGHDHLTVINGNARRAFGGFVTASNHNPQISQTANPDAGGLLSAT